LVTSAKNLLDLKDRDREIYFFHKKNPDFPVEFISERLRIGLLSISIANLLVFPISKEGTSLQIESLSFGMIS